MTTNTNEENSSAITASETDASAPIKKKGAARRARRASVDAQDVPNGPNEGWSRIMHIQFAPNADNQPEFVTYEGHGNGHYGRRLVIRPGTRLFRPRYDRTYEVGVDFHPVSNRTVIGLAYVAPGTELLLSPTELIPYDRAHEFLTEHLTFTVEEKDRDDGRGTFKIHKARSAQGEVVVPDYDHFHPRRRVAVEVGKKCKYLIREEGLRSFATPVPMEQTGVSASTSLVSIAVKTGALRLLDLTRVVVTEWRPRANVFAVTSEADLEQVQIYMDAYDLLTVRDKKTNAIVENFTAIGDLKQLERIVKKLLPIYHTDKIASQKNLPLARIKNFQERYIAISKAKEQMEEYIKLRDEMAARDESLILETIGTYIDSTLAKSKGKVDEAALEAEVTRQLHKVTDLKNLQESIIDFKKLPKNRYEAITVIAKDLIQEAKIYIAEQQSAAAQPRANV